jgi:hypothetical protein
MTFILWSPRGSCGHGSPCAAYSERLEPRTSSVLCIEGTRRAQPLLVLLFFPPTLNLDLRL